MSSMRPQLLATAETLFAGAPDWAAINDAGFALLLVPEADDGFGGDWGDAFAVLRVAGAKALAQPVGEAMLAAHLLTRAGVVLPPGRLTIAAHAVGAVIDGHFTGSVGAVPWGGDADVVAAMIDGALFLLPRADAVRRGASPAGEARDTLDYAKAPVVFAGAADLLALGAFLRVSQAAGALDAALVLAVAHVNARVQFGKPLSKLQAVQQALAVLASEAAAVNMAGAAMAAALDLGDASFEIAAAKLRTNIAIERGVAIAHQVHGAIGFTQDYPLHHLTRRLMGWRSEFGGEALWAERLGVMATAQGGAGLWAEITRRGDRRAEFSA
jgi:acyl-CoA dehydrogenase